MQGVVLSTRFFVLDWTLRFGRDRCRPGPSRPGFLPDAEIGTDGVLAGKADRRVL